MKSSSLLRVASLFIGLLATHAAMADTREALHSQQFEDRDSSLMIDFTQEDEATRWSVTNDSVMGGLSAGRMALVDNYGVFSGVVSLENNGGFTSINRPINALPSGLGRVEIDIEGDGSTYQLRAAVLNDGYRMSYKHDFKTEPNVRQTLSFSLLDFQASFRGRLITDAPELQSEHIRQVGFLVANKQQGPFTLKLYKLTIIH
ncbi:CIA30 family protein [Vibrio sp. 10N.261.55.A7]|uniref:CIA30 family protein n=1 Tax=Vibrio sp. 10N.261.55.A7 TaxID=1880851 RepID=UPI001F53A551|nr:CIA30 family protein [Vibrio sp. 10N.261.55.A7]